MSKNVSDVLSASMSKVREMVDANTVVGSPITVGDGTTLIPISKINFALASGGADMAAKLAGQNGTFGGGAGCAVKITPETPMRGSACIRRSSRSRLRWVSSTMVS